METLQTSPKRSRPRQDDAAAAAPLSCSAVLTHHWLVRYRGGERVLAALCALLPDAPIYTLVHDPTGFRDPGEHGAPSFQGWGTDSRRVITSFLQSIPGARQHYPKLLPLMPLAARRVRLPPVDLVVCSDAALAKAMTPDPRSKVVCYCHSPARYVWDLSETYRQTLPVFLRPLWNGLARRIREADRRAAQRVDQFVANSRHVADRIRRHYGRDSVVVHPPVDLPPEPATSPREDYYLCVGHHVPYKRLDLAVEACRKLGRRLIVIGEGPDVEGLAAARSGRRPRRPSGAVADHALDQSPKRERGPNHALNQSPNRERGPDSLLTLLDYQPDDVVHDHYRRARALLFPGEEDFGIVPVEAMAHGCPVIAYGVGGATESVLDGQTGVWFEHQTVDCLADAIQRAEATTFDPPAMHAHTQQFSRTRFLREMRRVFVSALERPRPPA